MDTSRGRADQDASGFTVPPGAAGGGEDGSAVRTRATYPLGDSLLFRFFIWAVGLWSVGGTAYGLFFGLAALYDSQCPCEWVYLSRTNRSDSNSDECVACVGPTPLCDIDTFYPENQTYSKCLSGDVPGIRVSVDELSSGLSQNCRAQSSAGAADEARARLDLLFGASTLWVRFGWLGWFFLQKALLQVSGYEGASFGQVILSPRRAAAKSAAAVAALAEEAARGVPAAASWEAIAAVGSLSAEMQRILGHSASRANPPSSWDDARTATGLNRRQAGVAGGMKLLLWHWTQPVGYLVVLWTYYCSVARSLGGDSYAPTGTAAIAVAAREVAYLLSTLLALWVNPAFLLLELDSIWKRPDEQHDGVRFQISTGGSCRWYQLIKVNAMQRWVLYLMAPHHYVTMCLTRWAESAGNGAGNIGGMLLRLFGAIQLVGDFLSANALSELLQQPSPPVALAIGYWLTTAGLVTAVAALLIALAHSLRQGLPCLERSITVAALLGSLLVFLFGSLLLVLAPLKLVGLDSTTAFLAAHQEEYETIVGLAPAMMRSLLLLMFNFYILRACCGCRPEEPRIDATSESRSRPASPSRARQPLLSV